nr:MAG TPA: zinc-ribbon family protein [Caudoviricetes sp.]
MANYPEYLERNALIERIQKVYCDGCENYNGVRCRACGTGDAIEVVEDAPTDLERTARWIWIVQDGTFTRFECSGCHTKNHHTRWNYCPNCGAKMENAHG